MPDRLIVSVVVEFLSDKCREPTGIDAAKTLSGNARLGRSENRILPPYQ